MNSSSRDHDLLRRRFVCLRCGNCCRIHGYVRVTAQEIDDIASYLKIPQADFLRDHTRLLPDRSGLALLEKPTGECPYLDPRGGCMIQAVKPRQCRDFPFTWDVPGWEDFCEGGKALKKALSRTTLGTSEDPG